MSLQNRMPALNIRVVDRCVWRPEWIIHEFLDTTGRIGRMGQRGASIAEISAAFPRSLRSRLWFTHNLLLNEGINALWTLVCGTGETKFDNTNAYIGVGDSSTAASASQTGLQAASNKLYKAMDATYPTYGSSQKATWRSTFGTSDANFDWNEITVANGNSDSAKNLNRKVQAMGTKTVSVSRVVTLEITLS